MRFVINTNYGGFSLPKEFCEASGLNKYEEIDRRDSQLIDFMESHDGYIKEGCTNIELVEITDTATESDILEYDGCETIVYVVAGKICYIGG